MFNPIIPVVATLFLLASPAFATPIFGTSDVKELPNRKNMPQMVFTISLYANSDCSGPYLAQVVSGYLNEGKEEHVLPDSKHFMCVEMVTAWKQPCKFNLIDFVPDSQSSPSNGLSFVNGWPKGKYPIHGKANGVEINCAKRREEPKKSGAPITHWRWTSNF
ncbi:hypothetical protein D9757_009057 [Collybiopsis confluens]|uniref:Uncharacterized protein n=1 Tax=Collybiopsis confluens TaxID=2823264 RepID=A0A8H5HDR9_9AGAR|nr:hypothetical protein D9757_009057 [Collybiopsis confluens]